MSSPSEPVPTAAVTVLMPALEHSVYMDTAIASILDDPDALPNLRVVVIFDGNRPVHDPEWASDPRVTIAATPARSGSGAASNLGASLADSKYIARMDADDVSVPGRLMRQILHMEANPDVVLSSTGGAVIDENGAFVSSYPNEPNSDARRELLSRNPVIHSSAVARNADFAAVGGYDAECLRMQDYELILRLARRGRVTILDDELILYRVHSGQTSSQPAHFWRLMRLIALRRRELASELGVSTLSQTGRDLVFTAAQFVRYAGLRKPRHSQAPSDRKRT